MKAIIEFNLEDEDDKLAHLRAIKSLDMAHAIWDIQHSSKKGMYHKIENAINEDINFTPYDAIDIMYENIIDIILKYNISTDDLIH